MLGLNEYIMLNEQRVVKYDGQESPKFGWLTILIGGGGSGKGSIRKTSMLIDGRVLDVDKFKTQLLTKMAHDEGLSGAAVKEYIDRNLSDPNIVSTLHNIVKSKRWPERKNSIVFNRASHPDPERLPNVILDITGKHMDDIARGVVMGRSMGYKIKVIWVLTDMEVALFRNLRRIRKVNGDIIADAHHNVYATALNVMDGLHGGCDFSGDIDSFDIVFNSGSGPNGDMTADEKTDRVIELIKNDGQFVIPEKFKTRFRNITAAAAR